ncbi:hypothetical protein ACFXO9_37930 [Nocardia tengchongensis]|uniref:hypothetical protein n=1 Tax=Nocardia tengchongensis TaxID=2055889 RepID=UPI0036CDE8E5
MGRDSQQNIPTKAEEYCQRWRDTVLTHNLDGYFDTMRNPRLRYSDRSEVLNDLHGEAAAVDRPGVRRGGW